MPGIVEKNLFVVEIGKDLRIVLWIGIDAIGLVFETEKGCFVEKD